MLSRRTLLRASVLGSLATTAFGARAREGDLLAQGSPAPAASAQKPLRIIVPYAAGGPIDAVARALAEKVKDTLGVTVVENRPGAGGNIGVEAIARSAPDGQTIGFGAVATHAINPWLFARLPFDPVKDFSPITLVAHVPNVLVLTPETAARYNIASVRDLIDHARRHPGRLNYASGGNGSAGHMAGELLKASARVHIVHIPYAGAAPATLGLFAGQTDLMFDNLASAAPHIRAGKLKAFAVTTRQRSAALPELPTMIEAGGPELAQFDVSTWFGLVGPAGVPAPTVERLGNAFRAALAAPDMRERLGRMGAEPAPTSPDEFARLIRSELVKYEKVVKYSGARVD